MNKPTEITKPQTANEKVNGWKVAKNIAVALAPSVITAVACAVIIRKLDKE